MVRFLLLPFLLSTPALAQDTLAKLSGEKLFVKVLANTTNTIDFVYPGETATNSIPKSLVRYVRFASGRREQLAELVQVDGLEGWRNVIVTNNPADVAGLERLGDINAKTSNDFGVMSATNVDSRAAERIKKQAAALGAHIVLTQQNSTNGSAYGTTAKSFKSGVAYGYPFKRPDAPVGPPTTGESARRFYTAQKAKGGAAEPAVIEGQKVAFEYEGVFYVGEIVKRTGNFYKVKYTTEKGKEDMVSRHVDKVAFF